MSHSTASLTPLNVVAVLASPPPQPDFVLPGLPLGSVGLLVGRGGVGKTFFGMSLGSAIALGLQPLNGLFDSAPEGRTVFLCAEESPELLAGRLHHLVGGLSEDAAFPLAAPSRRERVIQALSARFSLFPMAGKDARLLIERRATHLCELLTVYAKGARLLIVDPLRRLHDGDEIDPSAMTQLVQLFERIAQQAGCAVLVMHHINKSSSQNGLASTVDAVRGSTALVDGVRWVANLEVMGEKDAARFGVEEEQRRDYLRFDVTKSNYAAPQPTRWLKRGSGGVLGLAEDLNSQEPAQSSSGRRSRRARRDY